LANNCDGSGDTMPRETPNTELGYDLKHEFPGTPWRALGVMPQALGVCRTAFYRYSFWARYFLALQQRFSLCRPPTPAVAANGNRLQTPTITQARRPKATDE
jgi:hypothetical protein